MPEIPVGAEAGLFQRLVRGLLRVPKTAGEDVTKHNAAAFTHDAPGVAGVPFRVPKTHAELRDAVANGRDTTWLTRRALTEAGPEGVRALQTIDKYRTKVEYGNGGGSFYDHSANSMHIDLNNGEPGVGLVHEAGHVEWAHTGSSADVTTMGKDQYVSSSLQEEADVTVRQIFANLHLQARSPQLQLPPTALQHEFTTAYSDGVRQAEAAAYAQGRILTLNERAIAGDAAGRQAVYNEFMSGRIATSNTGIPYPQYYGDGWEKRQNVLKNIHQNP